MRRLEHENARRAVRRPGAGPHCSPQGHPCPRWDMLSWHCVQGPRDVSTSVTASRQRAWPPVRGVGMQASLGGTAGRAEGARCLPSACLCDRPAMGLVLSPAHARPAVGCDAPWREGRAGARPSPPWRWHGDSQMTECGCTPPSTFLPPLQSSARTHGTRRGLCTASVSCWDRGRIVPPQAGGGRATAKTWAGTRVRRALA